jgi:hypothetical protein
VGLADRGSAGDHRRVNRQVAPVSKARPGHVRGLALDCGIDRRAVRKEACEFTVDTNQYEALKSHVECVKGERLSCEVVPFKLSIPEEREVWQAKGIQGWSPGVSDWDWDELRLQAAIEHAECIASTGLRATSQEAKLVGGTQQAPLPVSRKVLPTPLAP